MSQVRVLVGTRKGAFVLTSDGKREKWAISGPNFAGWEIYHLKGSPADPNRIYASQTSGWFGQIIQRSDDGGKTWHQPGTPAGEPGRPVRRKAQAISSLMTRPPGRSPRISGMTARSIRGSSSASGTWNRRSPTPVRFMPVWKTPPCFARPMAARTGRNSPACGATARVRSGSRARAGCACILLFLIPAILTGSISPSRRRARFAPTTGGDTWKPINRGLYSQYIPDPRAEIGHCVHHVAMHPSRPNVLFMQKHWDVMRSDDAGDSWQEISGNLPTDFGFVIDVHAHEPETIYVVPIQSDSVHYVPEGKLRVFRSRTGGNEWEALSKGLPQKDCYVNVLRDAMAVDSLDKCGVYFGTSGGQVYASADAGDSWAPIVRDLPAVLSVEVQTLR